MKIEIYSDIVCPWCYVGERRLARALTALGDSEIEVVYRPFQLDPEAPEPGVPLKEYLQNRYGARSGAMMMNVSGVAAQEGIEIDWDRAISANTAAAHRLLTWVEAEYGAEVQRQVVEKFFDLHFTRGGDVSDIGALVAEAEAVGVDGARARAYLESDAGRAEFENDVEAARRLGVSAVPTFVFEGRYALQGAQPVSAFVQTLEKLRAEVAGVRNSETGAVEGCVDGSCDV